MLKQIICLTVLGTVYLVSSTATARQSEVILPFDTIIKYTDGATLDQSLTGTVFIIGNRHAFRRIWKLAHFKTLFVRPPLPEIDFSNRTVIAVFFGYYGPASMASITKIVKAEDGLRVIVRQTNPGANCPPSPALIVTPVQIVDTEKVEKNLRQEDARLIVDREVIDCKPPN